MEYALSLVQVREVLERAFTVGGGDLTASMRAQIASLRGVSGPVTMLELEISSEAPPIDLPSCPYKGPRGGVRIAVVDAGGESVGGILLWLDDGYLTTLEYFWYTDMPPAELPPISQIVAVSVPH